MPNRSAKIIPDRSGGSVSRGVSLFSSRILARNMLLNVAGQGIPMISALVAIPILIHAIGTDRYGVLTIIWMVINYFYVFDMGISRSTIKFVS